jgi:hypothetical protein
MGNNLSNAKTEDVAFNPLNMLAMLRRLSKILAEEIAMLDVMNLAGISTLYNDKIELISSIEGYKTTLAANPEILHTIPATVIDQLKKEAEKFEILVDEDSKQLERAMEVHKLIMKAVRSVLEKKMAMSAGYNKNGIVDINKKSNATALSISVNEKI